MNLQDRTFQGVFSNLFVYNILFEDSEVDERYLGLDETSSVLGITGAGCRMAGHLSQHPRRIDAVDINRHHLAVTGLKMAASRELSSYTMFYDLFGRGWTPQPGRLLSRIAQPLPGWMQRYWKRNHGLFARSLHGEGLTSRLLGAMRKVSGVDTDWLRSIIARPIEERCRAIDEVFAPVFRSPLIATVLKSPLNLLALGVNWAQRDRMLRTEATDIVGYFVMHMKRVAATDLARNWFAWWALTGQFNHDDPEAVPPYLRRDRFERAQTAPTRVNFHHTNIFDVLGKGQRQEWSHYTLCDAPDWMPHATQAKLFSEILRTSRPGGVLQYRSVEDDSLIARHGLERHFQPMVQETTAASAEDRSRQYRRVNFYRIVH